MPLVHRRGGVDRDLLRLRLSPATLSISKEVVDDFWVVAIDPATPSVTQMGRDSMLNPYCILSV
jgi:hypothetical protein